MLKECNLKGQAHDSRCLRQKIATFQQPPVIGSVGAGMDLGYSTGVWIRSMDWALAWLKARQGSKSVVLASAPQHIGNGLATAHLEHVWYLLQSTFTETITLKRQQHRIK